MRTASRLALCSLRPCARRRQDLKRANRLIRRDNVRLPRFLSNERRLAAPSFLALPWPAPALPPRQPEAGQRPARPWYANMSVPPAAGLGSSSSLGSWGGLSGRGGCLGGLGRIEGAGRLGRPRQLGRPGRNGERLAPAVSMECGLGGGLGGLGGSCALGYGLGGLRFLVGLVSFGGGCGCRLATEWHGGATRLSTAYFAYHGARAHDGASASPT